VQSIRRRGLTVVDIVTALDECGYPDLAQRTSSFLQARLLGDHLQTSAIFDEQLQVPSPGANPRGAAELTQLRQPRPLRVTAAASKWGAAGTQLR
jgi:propanediol dehydratase large subunit